MLSPPPPPALGCASSWPRTKQSCGCERVFFPRPLTRADIILTFVLNIQNRPGEVSASKMLLNHRPRQGVQSVDMYVYPVLSGILHTNMLCARHLGFVPLSRARPSRVKRNLTSAHSSRSKPFTLTRVPLVRRSVLEPQGANPVRGVHGVCAGVRLRPGRDAV